MYGVWTGRLLLLSSSHENLGQLNAEHSSYSISQFMTHVVIAKVIARNFKIHGVLPTEYVRVKLDSFTIQHTVLEVQYSVFNTFEHTQQKKYHDFSVTKWHIRSYCNEKLFKRDQIKMSYTLGECLLGICGQQNYKIKIKENVIRKYYDYTRTIL